MDSPLKIEITVSKFTNDESYMWQGFITNIDCNNYLIGKPDYKNQEECLEDVSLVMSQMGVKDFTIEFETVNNDVNETEYDPPETQSDDPDLPF